MSKAEKQSEQALPTFNLHESINDQGLFIDRCAPTTFWLPLEEKRKFDEIQKVSNRSFGKHIKAIILKEIEKVAL